MDKGLSEVVVVRPTAVFLSFLTSQLPQEYRPTGYQLQKDNTAYLIKKKSKAEQTLEIIEQRYPQMFRHEIGRWLGPMARNKIERSYLDFLCCFELEFHSHLMLLESKLQNVKNMLQFRPRTELLEWLIHTAKQEHLAELIDKINLNHLTENATVLLRNFQNLSAIKPFLKTYYKPIFATLMSRMSGNKYSWPQIDSYELFQKYFSVEIHTQVISYVHDVHKRGLLWNQ